MDIDKAIKGRKSVHKFDLEKPDWRDIIECIDAARYTPMAGNNYSLKFIVVSEEDKIKKIAKSCQQDFIAKAPYLVVVCSNPSRTVNAYGTAGEIYARQQAGAGIQNFLLKAESLGLSTCWIGFFVEGQIKKALDIPHEIDVEAVIPLGYDAEKKRTRKAKIDMDRILYFNEWEQTQMKKPKKLDV